MLELTSEQARAIETQQPTPLQLIDPATQEVFVLIRKDVYDLTRRVVGGAKGEAWDDDADNDLIAKHDMVRKPA